MAVGAVILLMTQMILKEIKDSVEAMIETETIEDSVQEEIETLIGLTETDTTLMMMRPPTWSPT